LDSSSGDVATPTPVAEEARAAAVADSCG